MLITTLISSCKKEDEDQAPPQPIPTVSPIDSIAGNYIGITHQIYMERSSYGGPLDTTREEWVNDTVPIAKISDDSLAIQWTRATYQDWFYFIFDSANVYTYPFPGGLFREATVNGSTDSLSIYETGEIWNVEGSIQDHYLRYKHVFQFRGRKE